jgi:hypothetical protein
MLDGKVEGKVVASIEDDQLSGVLVGWISEMEVQRFKVMCRLMKTHLFWRRRCLPLVLAHDLLLQLPCLSPTTTSHIMNEHAAIAREMHTSAIPSLLSSPQFCPPELTGILHISGFRGLGAAALLSHGKPQGQNVYCKPAAYAQGDTNATVFYNRTTE